MSHTSIISGDLLQNHLQDPNWLVVDCRSYLTEPGRGLREYEAAHIPGALYADLEKDLSGPIIAKQTGRHPLPEPHAFAKKLSAWGVHNKTQVIAYDQGGGALASRLWWMLRWLGHENVAVLEAGWPGWQRAGFPSNAEVVQARPAQFEAKPRMDLIVPVELLGPPQPEDLLLVDSRERPRYLGEVEPIDKQAGHIPGALSFPFGENLDQNGCFLSKEALRARFETLDLQRNPVFYCGSGVTAAFNLLAMYHAGLGDGRLYPGSWSEWIAPETRPIATGEEPS